MAFLDTLGAEIKASFKRIPFSSVGGQGYNASNQISGWNGVLIGNRQPGATLNYDELAGDPLDNRVVAACVEAVSSALPEAPPILEKRKGDDWERIPDHPVLDLLHRPNDYHTTYHLWNATIGSELTASDGSAYWQVVMNDAGTAPVELWFEPRAKVLWNAKEFISGYQLERDGKWVDVKNDQIIHFRNSLNPYNTRLGRNALSAGKRQITGDNAAATYHSALLLNSAVASLLVTLKDGGTTTLTPEQLNDYMERLTNKLRGEGAGKIAGSNLPIDVHKLAYSPDEMAIDKLISYYEVSICALLKVPAMVIGLGSGSDGKTYANYGEAIRDFWLRTIIPAQTRRGAEITTQLLPLFGLDASQYRLSFDYSNVKALTEDDNPLMDVLVKVCGGAFMTKNEARSRLKMEPLKEGGDEIAAPPPVAPPAPDASNAPPTVEAKSYNPRQPRDDIGRWSDGAGGVSAGHAAHVMRSEGISDKDAAGVLGKIKDGTHKTREDVLAHIDSVHVMGKAPKRNGAYVGAAPFHSWNRVGGKGLAGSFYASDADVEGHGGAAWRQSQPVFGRMKFAADDKVLNVDATANPSASGEYAFAHLATARDRTDLDGLLRDHPDDLGLDLLFMDAVGALRAKEKGLAGIVSYDSGKVGDAVDLRDHSANELQTFVNKLLTNGLPKAEAKSWDESQHPRAENGEFGSGGSAASSTRTPEPQLSAQSQRAKASAKVTDKAIQRYSEEHNEPMFARAVGGVSFPDSEPIDVAIGNKKGVVQHGIEIKTVIDSSRGRIDMNPYAQVRKIDWEQRNKSTLHTVVMNDTLVYNALGEGKHDDSKRVYYYRRGVAGSAHLKGMERCETLEQVRKLMAMPEAKLPKGAQRTDGELRVGQWKPISDAVGKGFVNTEHGRIIRPKK